MLQDAASAQAPGRTLVAVSLAPEDTVVVDGLLDEAFWQRATPAADFLQLDPDNGAAATERTEVRIAFDRQRLYIGVTCYDSDPRGSGASRCCATRISEATTVSCGRSTAFWTGERATTSKSTRLV